MKTRAYVFELVELTSKRGFQNPILADADDRLRRLTLRDRTLFQRDSSSRIRDRFTKAILEAKEPSRNMRAMAFSRH
jgi:hypothetical protein